MSDFLNKYGENSLKWLSVTDDQDVLNTKIKSDSDTVKRAVLSNPHTPPKVLEMGLRDGDFRIRHLATEHPNLTKSLMDVALNDSHPVVRRTAEKLQNSNVNPT